MKSQNVSNEQTNLLYFHCPKTVAKIYRHEYNVCKQDHAHELTYIIAHIYKCLGLCKIMFETRQNMQKKKE